MRDCHDCEIVTESLKAAGFLNSTEVSRPFAAGCGIITGESGGGNRAIVSTPRTSVVQGASS